MRATKAKELRKLINLDLKNPNLIQKRLYRRLKKAYSKLSCMDKQSFMHNLKLQLNEQ
jgi:hypothetical protein